MNILYTNNDVLGDVEIWFAVVRLKIFKEVFGDDEIWIAVAQLKFHSWVKTRWLEFPPGGANFVENSTNSQEKEK